MKLKKRKSKTKFGREVFFVTEKKRTKISWNKKIEGMMTSLAMVRWMLVRAPSFLALMVTSMPFLLAVLVPGAKATRLLKKESIRGWHNSRSGERLG
jgi:hypothetical protein